MVEQFFINFNLIEGNGKALKKNYAMKIVDKTIKEIGKVNDFSLEGKQVIDLKNAFVMPGLINSHVHLYMEPYTWDRNAVLAENDVSITLHIIENMQKQLNSGVTFCRQLGGYRNLEVPIRDAVNENRLEGPEILTACQSLTISGGHGYWRNMECDGQNEFIKGVRQQIRAGADVIKILPTSGYGRPKMNVNHNMMTAACNMKNEEISAAVDEAHRLGKKVAAHCMGIEGIESSVECGVDSIEHGQFNDCSIDRVDYVLEKMANKGTWLVPTLSAFFKEYDRNVIEEKYYPVIESFQKAKAAGVKIAMGTDAGVPWVGHDKTAFELQHMVCYGMTPMEAITASTLRSAELLGIDDRVGTLGINKQADFLVLDKNPLDDIGNIYTHITQIYKKGKCIK